MPRPRAALRRAAATALGALLAVVLGAVPVGLVPGPAYAAQRAEEATPLTVTISSLSPSALRPNARGTVTVTGSVTNADDVDWLDVTVYPFVSTTPMTTTTELAAAAATDESVYVGDRLLGEGDYARVGDLAPGVTVAFSITLPRRDLRDASGRPLTAPGVYWFGVHAIGSGPEGDDGQADGRARTFLPLLGRRAAPVRAAVLVPLRVHLSRNADGSLASLVSWERMLGPDGRLGRVLQAATAPGGDRLSWLLDPALLDAVQQLADGNPPRNLGATVDDQDDDGDTGEEGSGSASPSPSATAGSASPSAEPEPDPGTAAVAALAADWLSGMLPVLRRSDVLALPYGDLDLAAAASDGPDFYDMARTRGTAVLEQLGISATPVVAPPGGLISADALQLADPTTPVVLSDAALPDELGWGTTTSPAVVDVSSHRVVVSSSAAASGGPAPGDPLADVPLRQRVLAEAAVRSAGAARSPLVVTLPTRWRPADPAGFVAGLDQSWLQLPGLAATTADATPNATSDATTGPTPEIDADDLVYPDSAAAAELPRSRFASADALIRAGRSLQRVLTRNDQVAGEVVGEALTDLGYPARVSDVDQAETARGWILAQLDKIRLQGPASVTLSGTSGRFVATVFNGLDEPVTVAIRPETDDGITISAVTSVEVEASGRATVLLSAGHAQVGVHNVTLRLVDSDGTPIGASAYVPIRAAQVSDIIWLFLAVGAALLFGAIGLRLARRLRHRPPGPTQSGIPRPRTGAALPDRADAP